MTSTSHNGGTQQIQLLRAEPENDSFHYKCPDCGDWVAEWMDCPHCGWYDGEAWAARVKLREEDVEIAIDEGLDLGEWR